MDKQEMRMLKRFITAVAALTIPASLAAQAQPPDTTQGQQPPLAGVEQFQLQGQTQTARRGSNGVVQVIPKTKELATAVARMARVGSANSPSFSPDGKWVSFISNMSGSPQVWVVPAEGGYPRTGTNGDDPVAQADWSPASDWIAVTIAPGGGLNTQVYVVKPDGTGMRLLTKGGEDNNGFDAWTEDGMQIAIDSSRDNPAARDSFMIDLASGNVRLVAKNPGVGGIDGISRDNKRALMNRLRSRGDNNLYLLDLEIGRASCRER